MHYMFTHNSRVTDNLTRRTRTGYALMQSRKLTVTGNRSIDDENYGILMNYITYSTWPATASRACAAAAPATR